MKATKKEIVAAFTMWDLEYRRHPEKFQNTVDHLLRSTTYDYGEGAAVCFAAYLKRVRAGE